MNSSEIGSRDIIYNEDVTHSLPSHQCQDARSVLFHRRTRSQKCSPLLVGDKTISRGCQQDWRVMTSALKASAAAPGSRSPPPGKHAARERGEKKYQALKVVVTREWQ